MEHLWDLLFQLMKHGTNTLHVVFILLHSIYADLKKFKQHFESKHYKSQMDPVLVDVQA
uniref:Uncharacterized protein n=1 Tax=Oncorhynchus kisutch TaxID=8019 RepID=A0A8C7K901_ONCKI